MMRWKTGGSPAMSLSGSVSEFALGDLLQVTAMQQRTCCISIDDRIAHGEIYFVSGVLIHACFGELAGHEAVYSMLAREQAIFHVRSGLTPPVRTVSQGWQQLVIEGARRRDEGSLAEPRRRRLAL